MWRRRVRTGCALEGDPFDGGADAFYEEVVGGPADDGADDGKEAAAGLCAHADQQLFRHLLENLAGEENTGFEAEGDADDGHQLFETDGVLAAAGIDDAEGDTKLL